MKNKINEIYDDIRGRIVHNPNLFTNDPKENTKRLSQIIKTVNITKCDLAELDLEIENGSLYLMYLLQTKNKINFGICPHCKIIPSRERIKIICKKGSKKSCTGFATTCQLNKKKPKIIETETYW